MRLAAVAVIAVVMTGELAAQCRFTSQLRCGNTVSARLENATCTFSDSSRPYHVYSVQATAGDVLDIFLESDDFPPYLGIYFGDDSIPKKWDDGSFIARVTYDVPLTGTYRVVASAFNAARSGRLSLSMYCESVCLRPFAIGGRDNQTITAGERATITAAIDGSRPWSWRWFDEANPGVTLSTSAERMTTPPLFATTDIGVTVTNSCGSVTRTAAKITVSPCERPTISVQPSDWSRSDGEFPSFTVIAAGSAPLTYTWYQGHPPDTSKPMNVHTATLNTVQPQTNVTYWVRVSNACGSVDSIAAELKWYPDRRRSVRH